MLKFNKILCPTDFSETSTKALQWAEYLAKRFDSVITVLHTIEAPLTSDPYMFDTLAAQRKAEEKLKSLLAPLTVKNDYLVSFGDPSSNIRKIAEDLDAGLIVMGTRGLKGFRHKFIGSTAEYMMRNANMPVVTISPACVAPEIQRYRFLIPVSQTEKMPRESDQMKMIVNEFNVQVSLMHVVSFSEPMYKVKSELLPFNTMTLETEVTRKNLMHLAKLMFEGNKVYGSTVGFGDIVKEILREADTGLYDFILMGAHSEHSVVPFAESKGYNILSEARIPVITVRS
jgi:nucleotide-binding universal stress UspA family protein